MKKDKRIALLTCYSGRLPWYFQYFIHSCRYNPSIDFYIVTADITCDILLPNNIFIIKETLDQISVRASKKLGFTVHIKHGYKLCDFKPAFGFIFSEELEGYDFWGHIDIDIIFGNIRNFLTSPILDDFELISVRPDWIPGCFLLFKNNVKMNALFMFSRDYKKVFTSDIHYCFDETNFAHEAFEDGVPYNQIKTEIESMMHVVKKMEHVGYINPYFDLHIIEGTPGKLKWDNGVMIYKGKYEILLYHLIRLKKTFSPPKQKAIPVKFSISSTRIY